MGHCKHHVLEADDSFTCHGLEDVALLNKSTADSEEDQAELKNPTYCVFKEGTTETHKRLKVDMMVATNLGDCRTEEPAEDSNDGAKDVVDRDCHNSN